MTKNPARSILTCSTGFCGSAYVLSTIKNSQLNMMLVQTWCIHQMSVHLHNYTSCCACFCTNLSACFCMNLSATCVCTCSRIIIKTCLLCVHILSAGAICAFVSVHGGCLLYVGTFASLSIVQIVCAVFGSLIVMASWLCFVC